MPDITVENLSMSFGGTKVLDGVSFSVGEKEFVTLLGPSGCGKTTTLMCIAGLQTPDQGRIASGSETFVDRLRLRKVAKRAVRERVAEVVALVGLGGLGERYPHQLSGGQQQRVALARALAYSPRVLLLDEPFSSLDAKLRERARDWLKELQHTLGLTTVFVTHDQHEALSMSDRILVMNDGRIIRDGTPEQVYREPGERFVAEFLGRCNFLTGDVTAGPDGFSVLTTTEFPQEIVVRGRHGGGATATAAIRPEDIEIGLPDESGPCAPGAVTDVSYLGDHYRYRVDLGSTQLTVDSQRQLGHGPVRLRIPPGAASFVE